MNETRNNTRIALLVVLPLVAALISGLVVYAVTATLLLSVTEERDSALARIGALESEIAELRELLAEDSSAEQPTTEESPSNGEPSTVTDPTTTADGRYFCFVREVVNETGTTIITVDFAELLTGPEAAAAAAAAGEESPPPNDYWISNVNPMLRTFPVRSGITVQLHASSGGTVVSEGYEVALGQWQDFYVGMSPNMERVREVPYWIEITDDTVTAIEEQYLP